MKKLLLIASTAILLLPGCCCFRDICDSCKPCRTKKGAPVAVEEGPVVITEGEVVKVKTPTAEIVEEEFDEILVK